MNKLKKYMGLFLLVFTIMILPEVPCFAASATVNLTSDHTEVTIGDTVYVYLKIASGTAFTDFEANITYDKSILEYSGGASVITGGSGYLKISDMGNGQLDTSRKYALEFKALKVGDCNLAFDGRVMVYDEEGNEMSVSSDTLAVTVKALKSASTDTSLRSLVTSPVDITPAFDKNVYEYSVNVSNETTKLVISAIPEDNKSNVSISGNEILQEGENKIIITVLAESGDIIEYTINLNREAAPTVTGQPDASNGASFEILQSNGDTYMVFSGKYKLIELSGNVIVPEGYSRSKLTISGVTVTAFIPNENPESDFVLLYAEDSAGKAGFYQYDRVQNTLQRYAGEAANISKYHSDINRAAVTIAFLSALSFLLLVAVIVLFLKKRK